MEENIRIEESRKNQPQENEEKVKRPSLLKRVRLFLGGILSDLASIFKGTGKTPDNPPQRQAKAQKRKHLGLFGLVWKIIKTTFKIAGRMLKPLVEGYGDVNAGEQKMMERQGKIVDGKQFKTGEPGPICPSIGKGRLLQEKQAYKDLGKGRGSFVDCPGDSKKPVSKQQADGRTVNRRKM